VILLHCASAACLSEAIGIFAAAVRQACFALLSAVLTFALLVVIRLQACSAVDRALESWIFFVASRHFCLAAATPLPEPAVDVAVDEVEEVDDDEEVFELPHALRAVAATTSTTRSAERRPIMPPSSRKPSRTGRTAREAAENPADKHLRMHTAQTRKRGCAKGGEKKHARTRIRSLVTRIYRAADFAPLTPEAPRCATKMSECAVWPRSI